MKVTKHFSITLAVVSLCLSQATPSSAAPRPPHPPWPQPALKIYSWDSEYWKVPWGSFAVNEEKATVAESWSGYALVREGMMTPVVVPVLESEKKFNVGVGRGTVRFWFAPNWSSAGLKFEGKGPGHLARLAELVNFEGKTPQVQWSLYVNEAGDTIYLTSAGKKAAQDILKAPIAFEAGDWQMVTLCYSDTNTTLSLDGELVAQGEALPALADGAEKTSGLVVGSDALGTIESAAEGQFEELTTFAHPLRKSDWQNLYFEGTKCRTFLGPLGTKEAEALKVAVLKEAGILPETYGMMLMNGNGPNPQYLYASNALWLEILSATNSPSGQAELIVHGTIEDVAYEILSKEDLTNSSWAGEQIIIGVGGQDWTPATIEIGTRTNNLFFWARSLVDTDGDGLPDWWESENGLDPNNSDSGNTGVSDGYKDGDNDGWTNMQEYQNGTHPNQFNSPPAPQGLFVSITNAGAQARLSWATANGPVTGYVIERSFDTNTIVLSSSAASYTDNSSSLPTGLYWNVPSYRIRATYAAGSSAWSSWAWANESLHPPAPIVAGQNGKLMICAAAFPPNAAAIRVGLVDFNTDPTHSITNVDLPVAAFANGVVEIPEPFSTMTRVDNQASGLWYTHWINSNGVHTISAGPAWLAGYPGIFRDGRMQLKQNLIFLLRTASPTTSFWFHDLYDDGGSYYIYYIETPTNYAYSGLYSVGEDSGLLYTSMDSLLPFKENYLYRNFAYNPTNLNTSGWLNTGVLWDYEPGGGYGLDLTHPAKYEFTEPTDQNPIQPLLSAGESQWTSWLDYIPRNDNIIYTDAGISQVNSEYVMAAGARNLFGLNYISFKLSFWNLTLSPGNNTPSYSDGYFYPETAQPQFQTVGYYFGRSDDWWEGSFRDPLPGHQTAFSPTNQTPLLLAGFGQKLHLAGYAKLAITNGYTDKFGYLGQYFDKAFKIATNGVVTTNQTGILSPFGEFFPTEPGPTALVTMPDLDTNERGTATVHVVKLQLDVNHDGVMDLNFTGPDNTSPSKPFRFWVNNDFDRNANGEEDDVSSTVNSAKSPDTGKPAPDCEYRLSDRKIPSRRDLEDFARLWICGITTNLYPSLPAGVVAELSWGDKGNPDPNNPTIEIFGTPEIDGGIGYLTNFYSAGLQTSNSWYAQRLGPGDSIPVLFYNNSAGWQHWEHAIWCGVKKGSGKLTLTFSQGTNRIAEVSAYIEVKDIKEMCERWTVGDNPPMAPTNNAYLATEGLPIGAPPFQYAASGDANTSYILLVDDYDLPTWKKDRYAETAFKRLYWQGYEGRFGLFRWPGVPNSSRPLDDSEFNAWRSGAGLFSLLTNLKAQYGTNVYVMAHGYGAVAAGEALRLAGTNNLVNTYIAMQGAVASHAYYPYLPNRTLATGTDDLTPNRYIWYYTNGAAPYFWGVAGAAAYINYFNTNDNVLTNDWRTDQDTKPALPLNLSYQYHWDGTNFLKGYFPASLLLFPTDRYEIFAYCDEARCEAIGAQPNLGGAFNVNRQLNLSTLYSPSGILYGDHNGQFKSYCADTWLFWRAVLKSMGLKE